MSEEEIKRYLATIGGKGGKAGSGQSKVRGDAEHYKRISKLAAKARKARRDKAKTTTQKRSTK